MKKASKSSERVGHINAVIKMKQKGSSYVPELDSCMKTLGIVVLMEDIPPMDLPNTAVMTELEKKLLKFFPQFSVYRELGAFSEKYKLDPKDYLTGEVFDFIYFGDPDWEYYKPAYVLYSKIKQDLFCECKQAPYTENYF